VARPLTWTSLDGVVHAVLEDTSDGFKPPHALIVACLIDATWLNGKPDAFGHIMSGEIRAENRRDTVTCLLCLAYCREA
jgi:hypothetical protein